jgi:hypothetical protein
VFVAISEAVDHTREKFSAQNRYDFIASVKSSFAVVEETTSSKTAIANKIAVNGSPVAAIEEKISLARPVESAIDTNDSVNHDDHKTLYAMSGPKNVSNIYANPGRWNRMIEQMNWI